MQKNHHDIRGICHVSNLISLIILNLKQFPYSKDIHDMHLPVNISRARKIQNYHGLNDNIKNSSRHA